jgi:hypothetical protein
MAQNLDVNRKRKLLPKRMQFALETITKYGYTVRPSDCGNFLTFDFKGKAVKHYVYSGWHSGKSITDGRGLSRLIDQIK